MHIVTVALGLWIAAIASAAPGWVSQSCDDIPEFSSTWRMIQSEFPFLGAELESIGNSSGAVVKTINESGVVIENSVKMTKCLFNMPTEGGAIVDGLREFVTYKEWERDGKQNARGMMVDYTRLTDPVTGAVTRRFLSVAVCRSPNSCLRRGIIPSKPGTEEPQPEPKPIVLDPSPKKPGAKK